MQGRRSTGHGRGVGAKCVQIGSGDRTPPWPYHIFCLLLHFLRSECYKMRLRSELCPNTSSDGAYSTPRPPSWWGGSSLLIPKPTQLSSFGTASLPTAFYEMSMSWSLFRTDRSHRHGLRLSVLNKKIPIYLLTYFGPHDAAPGEEWFLLVGEGG